MEKKAVETREKSKGFKARIVVDGWMAISQGFILVVFYFFFKVFPFVFLRIYISIWWPWGEQKSAVKYVLIKSKLFWLRQI